MTKRQDKVRQAFDKYTVLKKQIFIAMHDGKDIETINALQTEKHKTMNEAFGYLTLRERSKDVASEMQKVINSGVEGCDIKVMTNYWKIGDKVPYFHCLELQKVALGNLFQNTYVDTTVIIDTEEGLSTCHSDYFYNGVCNGIAD